MDVSLTEAAQLVKRSPRQMQRWIDSGRVAATKDASGYWRIDVAALGKIAPLDRAMLARLEEEHGLSIAVLSARLEQESARVARLEQELAELRETKDAPIPHRTAPRRQETVLPSKVIPEYHPNEPEPLQSVARVLDNGLPVGSIGFLRFADAHGVPRGTASSAQQAGFITCTDIDAGAIDGRLTHWVTPDDRANIIAHWRITRQGQELHQCQVLDCPCHES
jgi:hypothetical protein